MESTAQPTQRLIDERDHLLVELEALRNKIGGLEIAIELLGDSAAAGRTNHRHTAVTTTILELLREAGPEGLAAQEAVHAAARRGLILNRGSVSSLLSRMKRDGIVVYDNGRYKVKEQGKRAERRPRVVVPASVSQGRGVSGPI